MSTKIWLSPPHMGGAEEKYIREAFQTNWIAPLGPNVDEFEHALSGFLGGPNVAALSSGTAAIHLALVISGIRPGDEVLVSDFTFTGTVNPIVYQGAIPIFIDSESDSWNMDPVLLEEAILDRMKKSKKPRAIIVVDIYGMPANMEKLLAISAKYEIPLIEDAAESLGSRYNGQYCGTFGIMGCLSFNGNKIITTSGGGALVSGNEDFIRQAKYFSTQAREDTPHFEHLQLGYNYKMSNVLAGIGRGQMEVLDDRVNTHRRNNEHYRKIMADLPGWTFQTEPDEKYFSNYWLTTAIIIESESGCNTSSVMKVLEEDNIIARPVMKPMHMQPVFTHYPAYLKGVSEHLFRNGICLPSGSCLEEKDLDRIVGRIRSVAKSG
jgi:dTDP-4-amino-4,6-dideoxygalactose transaminase